MNILEKVGPNEKLHCSVVSLTGRAKESLSEHVFSSYKEVTYWNVFAYRYLGLHSAWPREPEVVGTLTFLSDEAS